MAIEPSSFESLVRAVLPGYALEPHGLHGMAHWGRVFENGCQLADATGVSRDVVTLFAVFHDSRRLNDGHDPEHGMRGAALAASLRGTLFELSDEDFERLHFACCWHTDQTHHDDPVIQCCWDADRLDLGRCFMVPDHRFLNTAAAKEKTLFDWAYGRGAMEVVPTCVASLLNESAR